MINKVDKIDLGSKVIKNYSKKELVKLIEWSNKEDITFRLKNEIWDLIEDIKREILTIEEIEKVDRVEFYARHYYANGGVVKAPEELQKLYYEAVEKFLQK